MIVEAVALFALVFGGLAGFAIKNSSKDTPQPVKVTNGAPLEERETVGHKSLMMQCRVTCGDRGVKRYQILIGDCQCAENSR